MLKREHIPVGMLSFCDVRLECIVWTDALSPYSRIVTPVPGPVFRLIVSAPPNSIHPNR